ncbi:MAG: hypothetical protein KBD43_11615 [Saprospiraceae bacterium]|nr:hypothetical protein [Saprospiraceae bacterium]
MKKTTLDEPISILALLRFSLCMINFMILNYYANNRYIRKFSDENGVYLNLFESPMEFNDVYLFQGARYEDFKHQNQYLMNPEKYHNYYLIKNQSRFNSVNKNTWDARQLNPLYLTGYVRHQIKHDVIYALLDFKQEEKVAIDRILNQDTCSLSEESTVIDYITSVSESRDYQIYFWVLGENEILLPHPQAKQSKVCSTSAENTHWRFDLMMPDNTGFELIEMVGFKKRIPESGIQSLIDTLSYTRFILFAYVECFLNLPLALCDFMLSILMPYLCTYTTRLALSSQKPFRDAVLNVVLCIFIWNVYEFQLNFDANIISVSQKLSHQDKGAPFCTLPLLFETHFYLKMTQLAFLLTFILFFASMMLATQSLKETFLEAFCIISAVLIVFSGVQFYQIASEFENSCAYNFHDALYCTAISNFFILSSHSLKLALFNGSFLKVTGQALSITQISMNNFVFFNKKNFEHINSETHESLKEINQESTNQTLLM